MTTASTRSRRNNSPWSCVPTRSGKRAHRLFKRVGSRSQTYATRQSGISRKHRTRLGPQYPRPITPILNMMSSQSEVEECVGDQFAPARIQFAAASIEQHRWHGAGKDEQV